MLRVHNQVSGGRTLWEGQAVAMVATRVVNGETLMQFVSRDTPPQLTSVMRQCFQFTADKRPSAGVLVKVLQKYELACTS